MKAIVLAAGEGKRLRPLTNDRPKCMVEFNGKPLIRYIIDTLKNNGIHEIAVVCGYKKEILTDYLKNDDLQFYDNNNYFQTNMVTTLFEARDFLDDEIVISYSDIIYQNYILKSLLNASSICDIVIDKNWESLWRLRMEDPLSDAETLKLDGNVITEIGKKPYSIKDIQGQYLGLLKLSKIGVKKLISFYSKLDRKQIYDGKDFDNMYMTTFLQLVADQLFDLNAINIQGGWIEVDTINDLKTYKDNKFVF